MAEIFKDGFAHYGTGGAGHARMAEGLYSFNSGRGQPEFLNGTHWLSFDSGAGIPLYVMSRVLPGNLNDVACSMRVWFASGFPTNSGDGSYIGLWWSAGSSRIAAVRVLGTGALRLEIDGGGNYESAPCLNVGQAHHVEYRITADGSVGSAQIRVDGTTVLDVGQLSVSMAGMAVWRLGNRGNGSIPFRITDLIVRDGADGFRGDLRVATLFPRQDHLPTWSDRPRRLFGNGVLAVPGSGSAVSTPDAADLELGSGDFTLELWTRFISLPTTTSKAVLLSKWVEGANARSWELFKGGPENEAGDLVFRISTDGTAGTVAILRKWPWRPDLSRWYHVAVSRVSGELFLFVDGVQLGAPETDGNVYADTTAPMSIGGGMSGATTVVANTSLAGHIDEVRITVGVGRYAGPFARPSAPFPRNGGGDPFYANVMLLSGYDSASVADETGKRTMTARGSAAALTVDDGEALFQSVRQNPAPRDDTFIEASLVQAQGTLTLTLAPENADEVTLGTQTYRFVETLAQEDDVLIDGIEGSLANLVAAVNGDDGAGTAYHASTEPNEDVSGALAPGQSAIFTARLPGVDGNTIPSVTDIEGADFTSTTLEGGADIPPACEFKIDPLPVEATRVESVTIVHRTRKTDAGEAKVRTSLVAATGEAVNGAHRAMGTAFTYFEDIYVTDPATGGALTPITVNGGRIRIDRTE